MCVELESVCSERKRENVYEDKYNDRDRECV